MKGFPYSERKRKELIPEMYWANRHIWESFFVENFGDKFQQLKETVGEAIRQIYGNIYTGYLGVDMLVYRKKQTANSPYIPA